MGNLAVGGTGKTPLVAHLARRLVEAGERPAVLSRGYGRLVRRDGVVVVRDRTALKASVQEAGDEPFMLAQALPGVSVLVAEDRYLAGRLAEACLGCTVHLLDDGFQHLALARDVDLVLVRPDELERPRVLPAGRLRERLAAAREGHALIVADSDPDRASSLGERLGVPRVFRLIRTLGSPRLAIGSERAMPSWPHCRVFAVAGIARPERFFDDLRSAGVTLVGTRRFRDHYWFDPTDLARVVQEARALGAQLVVTTEKDLVRLPLAGSGDLPVAAVPLTVQVEPAAAFWPWLLERLETARDVGDER